MIAEIKNIFNKIIHKTNRLCITFFRWLLINFILCPNYLKFLTYANLVNIIISSIYFNLLKLHIIYEDTLLKEVFFYEENLSTEKKTKK